MLGGAAIATTRLMHGLNSAGVNAHMLVIDKRSTDDNVARVGSTVAQRYNFIAERMAIFANNGHNRKTLFRVDSATHGINISRHPWVQQADVIVLGWINQGMLSLNNIEQLLALGKPIVWVMHDMWNCTGVCHHAGKCKAFHDICRCCPLLGSNSDDISTTTQRRKEQLYSKGGIHFVAVSHWLEEQCRRSALMRNANISVIANPFPTDGFTPELSTNVLWRVAPGKKIMVMGAARLDDPMKGLDLLIDTTEYLASEMPDVAERLHLVLYGNLRNLSLLDKLQLPYSYLGYVDDMRDVYKHAHIVLSTSQVESFGYTLVEGMACGCTPITTGNGGQVDIVKHMHNGYIAEQRTPHHIAQGILWALNTPLDRKEQHRWVKEHFDQDVIAHQHLALYKSLL